MQLTETIKLYPNGYQKELILGTMNEYIHTVNSLVSAAAEGTSISNFTSADVKCNLPSALKNQCIRDAKSIVKKYNTALRKVEKANLKREEKIPEPKMPVVKKPCCYINNQNFRIQDDSVSFPVMINGKSKRIAVSAKITERERQLLSGATLGTMRIVLKSGVIVAQIVYEAIEAEPLEEGGTMGIDLGIKCPAVSYCSDGNVRFYGNGRKNKYMRRHYRTLRKNLQKAKKPEAVKRINNKEQRIMKDHDHKLSREIVDTALEHNVKTIKMERLENIRSTTRTSRKNNPSLHNWSFYRLAKFIEYKAEVAGISVEYVDPK